MNNPTVFCFILNCHKGDTILILFLDRMIGKCNNFNDYWDNIVNQNYFGPDNRDKKISYRPMPSSNI